MPDEGPISSLFGVGLRPAPSNIMAEQCLLGAILSNNKSMDRAAFLRPEDFADPIHGRIFQIVRAKIEAGHLVDSVTLTEHLRHTGLLDDLGGVGYVAQLTTATVGIINATEYAGVVRDTAARRALIDIGEQLVNGAFGDDPMLDAAALAARAIADIDKATGGIASSVAVTLAAAMQRALDAMETARTQDGPSGLTTGFRAMDDRLGGLEPGLVYVIAGRPAMGKSSLGHQIAVNAGRTGVGVLELSLEMSAEQLGRRTLATAANVPIMAMKRGRISTDDASRIVAAQQELARLPVTIDDASGQTPSMIAAKARTAKRKHGLGLVMIDHLHLFKPEGDDARHGGTWAIERASGTVLQIAKDTGCPVLLLAQLNRGLEGREDKRPTLSDLRQAGAIEQDAYAVGFVYREEYYMAADPSRRDAESDAKYADRMQAWTDRKQAVKGRAEVVWAKVRDGEPGIDALKFDGPTATFSEGGSLFGETNDA